MDSSNFKSDKYTIGLATSGNYANSTVCSDQSGSVLFKVSNSQFIGTDGQTIGQIKQGQQGIEMYDGSRKLLGSASQKNGKATLNDASNKTVAVATKNSNSSGFNITAPDGKSGIATVSVAGSAQQGRQNSRGGFGGGMFGGMGGMGGGMFGGMGRGMGQQNNQNSQGDITISVQRQTLTPLLLLAFAYSLPKLLGRGGQQGRRRMGGMGAMGAGAILGGLLGGLGRGGGGSGGGRRKGRR